MRKGLLYYKAWWVIQQKKVLNTLSTDKHTDYTKFIILSSGRCGSTLLHTYLNSHPNILSRGEVLRELYDGNGPTAPKAINPVIFTPCAKGIKAVGIKLFYDYRIIDNFSNAFEALTNDPSIKIIHLYRGNKLEQFVSYKRAWRDLEWSANPGNDGYEKKIKVDVSEYNSYVENNQYHKRVALEMFKSNEIIDLTYEQLTEDGGKSLEGVQNFLGVEPRRLFTALTKQGRRPLSEMVENWDEIRRVIS